MQETEARGKFEAELRQQLGRQAAVHSDHLVSALHAQRVKLEAEFEKQLIDGVRSEKHKMTEQIGALANRVDAVESAVDGRLFFVDFFLSLVFWNWQCHKACRGTGIRGLMRGMATLPKVARSY